MKTTISSIQKDVLACIKSVYTEEIAPKSDVILYRMNLTPEETSKLARQIADKFVLPDFGANILIRCKTLDGICRSVLARLEAKTTLFQVLHRMKFQWKHTEDKVFFGKELGFSDFEYSELCIRLRSLLDISQLNPKKVRQCLSVQKVYELIAPLYEAKKFLFDAIHEISGSGVPINFYDNLGGKFHFEQMDFYDLSNCLEKEFSLPYFDNATLEAWKTIDDVYMALLTKMHVPTAAVN